MRKFEPICEELSQLVDQWIPRLQSVTATTLAENLNSQQRTIKQIVGHMVDSASNNTHRLIHMHYQESPVRFPDYANLGNNDRWIAIQNYQEEDWNLLIVLWASVHRHIVHLIQQVDENKLNQVWHTATGEQVSMEEMIEDFPKHFKLHINEIEILL